MATVNRMDLCLARAHERLDAAFWAECLHTDGLLQDLMDAGCAPALLDAMLVVVADFPEGRVVPVFTLQWKDWLERQEAQE